jgi:hypothetical protein
MNTLYTPEYPENTASRCTKQMPSRFHFFIQISSAHQSMQNDQGYPLIMSILPSKPSLLLRSSKKPPKPSFEVIHTPFNLRPSFAQRSSTHQSIQNHQGYPLMTSILAGKLSVLDQKGM